MDVSPIGVDGSIMSVHTSPVFPNDPVLKAQARESKAECMRCTDMCMIEAMLFSMMNGSCRQMRSDHVADGVADTRARMKDSIEELLDQGKTHEQIMIDFGLATDEYYDLYYP